MLISAVKEIEGGLVDADYGGNVFTKRIGINNQGKRGSIRTKTFFYMRLRKVQLIMLVTNRKKL